MKIKSYVFLFVMILILIFILGVRYGQNVEKNNKVVDYLLRLPSPTALPVEASAKTGPVTPTPLIYKDYKSKKWGLKFTYPAGLEVKEDATAPAILFEYGKN